MRLIGRRFSPYSFYASRRVDRPPGHLTERAKLLLILGRHRPAAWLLPRARELFDTAMSAAWDTEHGGRFYGFAPDRSICDADKYFWVQTESLAAAALLALRTAGDDS